MQYETIIQHRPMYNDVINSDKVIHKRHKNLIPRKIIRGEFAPNATFFKRKIKFMAEKEKAQ